MSKILSFTGGSVQGVGLSAIGVGIMETYNPDVIIGTSVSAIFAIPLAMRRTATIKEAMLSFDLKSIFGKYPPLNKKNTLPSFRGVLRALSGKDSLGKQDALIDFIKVYLTEIDFLKWQRNVIIQESPNVLIACTNFNTGKIEYFDLSYFRYEEALKIILASCNIPVLINGIEIGSNYFYDGGVISAQSGTEFLKTNFKYITEYKSVWNRAAEPKIQTEFIPKNIISVTKRSVELMIKNESHQAEYLETLICETNGIKHQKYFFETELDSLYDTDIDERKLDWENGQSIVTSFTK